VAEEIKKLRANIKYSERAIRIAQRIRQRISDRKKYWAERRELTKKHEEMWRAKRLQEKEDERDNENDLEDTCPHTKVVSGSCD